MSLHFFVSDPSLFVTLAFLILAIDDALLSFQVPYYDFMNFVKRRILLEICVPGGQRVSVEAPHQCLEMPTLKASR